jgi:hypothetical protein
MCVNKELDGFNMEAATICTAAHDDAKSTICVAAVAAVPS